MDLPFSDSFDKLNVRLHKLFSLQAVEMSCCVSAGDMGMFTQGTSYQAAFEGTLSYQELLYPCTSDTAWDPKHAVYTCMAQCGIHGTVCSVCNER